MTEKIEWYQEVFDIEPTSRIFLPLARLLKGEGALERAISVLQRGLVFHADMLEARLLLIECLYVKKDSSLLVTEMQKVTDVLKVYPTFFEAWATIAQAYSKDLALSVRLLSHVLRDPSATFVDVLARGLEESEHLVQTPQAVSTPSHAAYASPEPAPPAMSHAEADALLADTIAMANTLSAQYASELASMPDLVDIPDTIAIPGALSASHLTIASEKPISSENSISAEALAPPAEPEAADENVPELSKKSKPSETPESSEKPVDSEISRKSEEPEMPDVSKTFAMPNMPDTLVMPEMIDEATRNDTAAMVERYGMGAMPDIEIYDKADTVTMPLMPDIPDALGTFGTVSLDDAAMPSETLSMSSMETRGGTLGETIGKTIGETILPSEKTSILSAPNGAAQGDVEMPAMTELFDMPVDIFEVTDAPAKAANASASPAERASAPTTKNVHTGHDAESMLRTRSMADLLAQQGSLDEAMAIYIELEAHETDANELIVLQKCITSLRVQRGEEAQLGTVQEKASVPDSPVKGRILTVLESLAARLEARSLA